MRKLIVALLPAALIIACNGEADKKFTVSGTITNNNSKTIYLEKIPAGSSQPVLVDSSALDSKGQFSLNGEMGEAMVYNLRLGQSRFPLVTVINDADDIKLNVELTPENNQFAEEYEVKGSPASEKMKDFLFTFTRNLQEMFPLARQIDSLHRGGASDTLIIPLIEEQKPMADKLRKYTEDVLKNANNPALTLFVLGYYQETANRGGFGLEPFQNEQVMEIINTSSTSFPSHNGIAAVKATLEKQLNASASMGVDWTGKEAPDFSMPDVNGKDVKLSSFRGKYVLVDFWASWCGPCRKENPNLVKAYQQFRDKNFTILGVSLDRPGQKEKWLQAIKDDKLTWTNISDLQYWNSPVVAMYGFNGIPFNVLLDPDGKVIAQELRGQALEAKLNELLN